MKVLVVDDEPLARVGIKTILQTGRSGFEVVGDAGDGDAALAIARQEKPDIVLVDIRMPGMSGLDFIAEAKTVLPAGRFIILSGYKDFEYARQAMRLGVTDYVLKTAIDSRELLSLLRRVRGEIQRDAKARKTHAAVRERLDAFRPLAVEGQLRKLLDGSTPAAEAGAVVRRILPRRLAESRLYVAAVAVREPAASAERPAAKKRAASSLAVVNICSEALCAHGQGLAFEAGVSTVVLLAARDPTRGEGTERPRLESIARDCRRSLSEYMDLQAAVGWSAASYPPQQLRAGYGEALHALERGFYREGGRAVFHYEPGARAAGVTPAMREEAREMRREAAAGRFSEIPARVDRLVGCVRSEGAIPPNTVVSFFVRLFADLLETAAFDEAESEAAERALSGCATLESLAASAKRVAASIAKSEARIGSPRTRSLMEKIRSFVRANIRGEPGLEKAAAYARISPAYLSRIFKASTGIQFHDFVARERIAEAKRMLEQGMKVESIAEDLGYADGASLSRAFKRVERMTPRQYRDRLRVTE